MISPLSLLKEEGKIKEELSCQGDLVVAPQKVKILYVFILPQTLRHSQSEPMEVRGTFCVVNLAVLSLL